MTLVDINSYNSIMKPFLLFLVLLVLSRIETNEPIRTLDDTNRLLLPSLQTHSPVKTPSPNPGTGASVNMATTITERNFVGRKEATRTLDQTSHLLLPSFQTHPPVVKTPSPNPGTDASVNMATTITEKNFVGRKEAKRTLDKTSYLLLPSLQTRPPVKTPSPNPKTGASVNMASRITERNFAGRKEAAKTLDESSHLLLPSLQTRPPVKTPSPNPKTGASVNMATRVSERNFVGRKEATKTLDETNLLLPSLHTRPPVKTPLPNPKTNASANMAARATERYFVGRKEATRTHDETSHLLLPSLQTHSPVKTPSPNPETGASVNMATIVAERNFVGRKEVAFVPPLPPTNASPQNNVLCDVFAAKSQK